MKWWMWGHGGLKSNILHTIFHSLKRKWNRFLQQTTESRVVECIFRPHKNVAFNKLFFVICLSPQKDKRSSAQHNISCDNLLNKTWLRNHWVSCWIRLRHQYLVRSADCGWGPSVCVRTGLCAAFWKGENQHHDPHLHFECPALLVKPGTRRLVYQGCSPSPRSAPGLLKHPSP